MGDGNQLIKSASRDEAEVFEHGAAGRAVRPRPKSGFLGAVLIAAVFFAAIGPTLHWEQFHDSIENLNVATALEMRRGGPWLVPNLQGVPRLAKPPLMAWLTAASVWPTTVEQLSTRDPTARAAAYDCLAREVRLPALVAAALLLLFAYGLGWAAGGSAGTALGLTTECVCGTTMLVLRHARLATPDIQLALWVTAANFFLAVAVLRGRRWIGCCGAGTALGLAIMCKGPVALVQSVLPFVLFVVIERLRHADSRTRAGPRRGGGRGWAAPAVVGLGLMVAIGGWWFVYVATHFPAVGPLWFAEVARTPTGVTSGNWYKYAASLHLFLPWLVSLACGVWLAIVARPRAGGRSVERDRNVHRRAATLGLLLLAAPLLVMSWSQDRWERYVAPMAAGGALLAAAPLVEFMRGSRRSAEETAGDSIRQPLDGGRWQRRAEATAVAAHWVVLFCLCVSVGLVGADRVLAERAGSWPSWITPSAVMAAMAGAAAVGVGLLWQRRWRGALVAVTAVSMAVFQAAYYRPAARGTAGRSTLRPVADLIWQRYPDAEIYGYRPDQPYAISAAGNDLSIHLNCPLRWAADPSQIAPTGRPQVFVIYRPRRPGESPLQPPDGWELLAKPPGLDDRYVFVRPPVRP